MERLRSRLRHLAFYKTLDGADVSSELWYVTVAWLHALRLVDTWHRSPRRRAVVSSRQLRAVMHFARMMNAPDSRRRLSRVVDAISGNAPDAESAVARDLLDHASALNLEMKWHLAIDVCETVVTRLGRSVECSVLLDVVSQWAANARAAGRWRETRRVYGELLRLGRRCRSTEHVLRSAIGMANFHMSRGNYPRAGSIIDDVIVRARSEADAGRRSALWRALHTRGTILMNRGKPEEGIADVQEALPLCDDLAERESMVHDIASALIALGHLSAARDALLLLRSASRNHSVRLSSTINLMEIASLEGRADEFETLRRDVAGRHMRPTHRALFFQLAGEGYERLGQPERALEMYALAISTGEELGVSEAVVRAEARSHEIRARRYLPPGPMQTPPRQDFGHWMDAVAELRLAAGIPTGTTDP